MKRMVAAIGFGAACVAVLCLAGSTALAQNARGRAGGGGGGASAAEALYDQMVDAWHKADSLYYESAFEATGIKGPANKLIYKIWLKKPNLVRLEAYQGEKLRGTLVSDGETVTAFWQGRPPAGFAYEDGSSDAGPDATTFTSYTAGKQQSVSADASIFGIGLSLIEDPGMFTGSKDPMQQAIESGRTSGAESIGGEKCDVLVLTLSKGQGEITLWLSQADHLPRKAKRVISRSGGTTTTEAWSDFQINGSVASDKFTFTSGKEWLKIVKATDSEGLLIKGIAAPDFTKLAGAKGEKISLADYKGKVVWIHMWFAG